MEIVKNDFNNPQKVLAFAVELQKYVKENNLTAKVQGKDYPLVEAWQFAGSQLGLIPVVVDVSKIDAPDEIKYQSMVEIRKLSDNSFVAMGVGICSNKEKMKRHFEEYAVMGMAQTRAISRAYRNVLGWLMKAAGFEATPEEETDILKDVPDEEEKDVLRKLVASSTLTDAKKKEAYAKITGCMDYDLYQKIQYGLESLQQPYDQMPNPSATDAAKQTAKISKIPA